MFNIQSRELRQLERQLQTLASRSMPYVTQKTLNDAAFDAMNVAKANIAGDMINRNTWTQRSVRVNKADRGPISRQRAVVGSTEDYMETQEFGGKKKTSNVPTPYSAGQSPTARTRTRVPRKANRMSNLQLAHQRRGVSRKQRNFLAVRSGEKFVYLELERRRGIFRITGGKRNRKVNMVQQLGHKGARVKPNPWLEPAFNDARGRIPTYYAAALRYQMRRQGLL